eukprot:4236266-Pleurochrysis_carterae.AAC.4
MSQPPIQPWLCYRVDSPAAALLLEMQCADSRCRRARHGLRTYNSEEGAQISLTSSASQS